MSFDSTIKRFEGAFKDYFAEELAAKDAQTDEPAQDSAGQTTQEGTTEYSQQVFQRLLQQQRTQATFQRLLALQSQLARPPAREQIAEWRSQLGVLKHDNREHAVNRMEHLEADEHLAAITQFIGGLPNVDETRQLRDDAAELETRLNKRIAYLTFKEAIEKYPDTATAAIAIGDLSIVSRYRTELVRLHDDIENSQLLSRTQKRELEGLITSRDAALEQAELLAEEPTVPEQPPIEQPVVQRPPVEQPPAPPPQPPPVVEQPPVTPEPPQPPAALVREITRLERRNAPEGVEGMSLDRAISNLEAVAKFIEDNQADASAQPLIARAETMQENLRNRIFILVLNEVNGTGQGIESNRDIDDINSKLHDLTSIKDKVNNAQIDQIRRDSLLYAIGQLENTLTARIATLQQAEQLREVQQHAQEAINDAERAIEQFMQKALKTQQLETQVMDAASQCSGGRAFRSLREDAVNAISAANEAKQKALQGIQLAALAVTALPRESRFGLAIPTLPQGEEGRVPDANSLPSSQPVQVGQPVIRGRTMTVSCDCNGEISEQIPATADDFQMKIASLLNQWSFPPTMVLIAQVQVKLDAEGYVAEVEIRATDRVTEEGRMTGEELMQNSAMRNWYFKIASAFCKQIRAVNGRDGRTIRGISVIIRPGGGMSFQVVSE